MEKGSTPWETQTRANERFQAHQTAASKVSLRRQQVQYNVELPSPSKIRKMKQVRTMDSEKMKELEELDRKLTKVITLLNSPSPEDQQKGASWFTCAHTTSQTVSICMQKGIIGSFLRILNSSSNDEIMRNILKALSNLGLSAFSPLLDLILHL